METAKSIFKNNSSFNLSNIRKNHSDEEFLAKYDNDEYTFLFI